MAEREFHLYENVAEVHASVEIGEPTIYRFITVNDAPSVEFHQDPVDPSTFRRYVNGVRG